MYGQWFVIGAGISLTIHIITFCAVVLGKGKGAFSILMTVPLYLIVGGILGLVSRWLWY